MVNLRKIWKKVDADKKTYIRELPVMKAEYSFMGIITEEVFGIEKRHKGFHTIMVVHIHSDRKFGEEESFLCSSCVICCLPQASTHLDNISLLGSWEENKKVRLK